MSEDLPPHGLYRGIRLKTSDKGHDTYHENGRFPDPIPAKGSSIQGILIFRTITKEKMSKKLTTLFPTTL